MNKIISGWLFAACVLVTVNFAVAEEHDHDEKHEHEKTQGHEADGAAKGFTLSPEARKNFAIKTVRFSGSPLKLQRSSIFFGLEERNLFRERGGFFKRIDFDIVSKTKTEWTVTSHDLQVGDDVVTDGLGFLRIAELAATGGVSDGHSH